MLCTFMPVLVCIRCCVDFLADNSLPGGYALPSVYGPAPGMVGYQQPMMMGAWQPGVMGIPGMAYGPQPGMVPMPAGAMSQGSSMAPRPPMGYMQTPVRPMGVAYAPSTFSASMQAGNSLLQ